MMKKKTLSQISNNFLAILISLFMFVPIYLLVVNSLKDDAQSKAMGAELPTSIHFENYLTVFEQGKLGVAFINSLIYAIGATIIVVFLATTAAFVLSRNLRYFGDRNADKLCNVDEGDASNSSDQYRCRNHPPICSYQNFLRGFSYICIRRIDTKGNR